MHYYSFHPADYTLDTVHLDNEHDLCYRRLLDLYYTSEQPIPSETQRVSSRLRVGLLVLENVLREFFRQTPEGWVQDNCERKIAQYHAKAGAARENGKLGGRPPRLKETQLVNLANPAESGRNPAETGSKANQEPVTSKQEPTTTVLLEKEPKGKTQAKLANSEACYQANAEPIPLDLNTEEFRSAWEDWCNHRTAMAPRKPWTRLAARNSLAECLREGVVRSVQAISKSIANGWQGITFDALQTRQQSQKPLTSMDDWNVPIVKPNDHNLEPIDVEMTA